MGRAPRTKETLPDFHEWCWVTRHSRVFRGLTGCQRTPRFRGVTHSRQIREGISSCLSFSSNVISCTCIFCHILSSIFLYFPIFSSFNCHVLYFPMIFIYYAFHRRYFHMIFIYFIYHIFISYNLIFISCHLLVTSYILLTYIFMYFIRLSYLMTYTYTFLYLYILLVLYQIVLSPVGVQNIDFFFDTLRYPSCPNYLLFYLFLFRYTHIIIRLLGPEIKNA